MSIPANIKTELANLQAQVAAAVPLNNASIAVIKAMQLNAVGLVADIQTALVAPNRLDTWMALMDPQGMVSGFNLSLVAAQDLNSLSLMRGVVGRVASNLNQLV